MKKKEEFMAFANAAKFHMLYKDIILKEDTYVNNQNDAHFMSIIVG